MNCPKCGAGNLKVINSRGAKGDTTVYRRRLCSNCKHRFSTYESESIIRTDVMSRFPIETNMPMPASRRGKSIWIDQLSSMKVGESFLLEPEFYGDKKVTVQTNIHHAANSKGWKVRTLETNKGLRVWLKAKIEGDNTP